MYVDYIVAQAYSLELCMILNLMQPTQAQNKAYTPVGTISSSHDRMQCWRQETTRCSMRLEDTSQSVSDGLSNLGQTSFCGPPLSASVVHHKTYGALSRHPR